MEQIKALFEAMENDAALQEEMLAIIADGKVADIIAAAGKKGFTFSEADWQEYLGWSKELDTEADPQQIPAEDLEQISGGSGGAPPETDVTPVECWFHAASEKQFRDGAWRKKCNQFSCTAFILSKGICRCGCYKTNRCVNSWHLAEGC